MKRQLLSVCLLLPLSLHAQHLQLSGDNCNISYLTMEDGLLHNYIDDIYKDNRGFIWFSTGGGLSRYDGFSFTNYQMETSPVTLKGNSVHRVYEDNFNRLWIASDGGLDILDLENSELVNLFEEIDPEMTAFLKNPVKNIIKDNKGNIWLLSGYIYKIHFNQKGGIADIFRLPENLQSVRYIAMNDVDGDGNIWAGYNDNIYKLYTNNNHNLRAVPISKNLKFRSNSILTKFLPDKNEVWIGTVHGLYRYYRNEDAVKVYENNPLDPTSLSHNYISDLALTETNQVIIGTLKGINIYNPMTDGFEQVFSESSGRINGLNSNFISRIYYDGNSLWCGTETGGVNKINSNTLDIKSYSHRNNERGSISQNPVNVILEDEKHNLWVGTVEGGLNLKKEGEETFSHFTDSSSTRLSHNSVSALSIDNKSRLWVSTWGYGISVIDKDNPFKPSSIYINSGKYPELLIDLIGGLFYDDINNVIWIGSNQGLYFYDLDNDNLITPAPIDTFANIQGIIGMAVDNKGFLWVGSQEGVYAIDLNSRNHNQFGFHHYRYKLDNPQSFLVEKITSFCLDSDNVLWLGSDGFGFYKRIEKGNGTYSFQSYNIADGLANNSVKGILEDDFGNLWISTSHGLSCFNREEESFINFFRNDGIENNQFYWNAYHKAKNGTLYFGTLSGLIALNPALMNPEPVNYRVTLTDFYLENEKIYPGKIIEKDISCINKITLHEKYKSFSIDFSALNFTTRPNFVYVYRLAGYEEKWIELPQNMHSARYMNLPPGNYTFQVKYVPKNQIDLGEITALQIYIKPYFYKTTWFALVVLILFISAFLLWYFRHIRSYEEQQKVLEQIVDERTKELEMQKETLVEQKKELSQQNLILSQQNEKITQQKNQLIKMSRKVHRMHVDKLEFFTNISHEFRTPITLIIGPVQRAIRLSSDPHVIEQLNYVERNSRYLLNLVNQLMDFQKVESKKIEITFAKDNFLHSVESILSSFEPQVQDRDISLLRRFSLSDPLFFFDSESLHKILINLLSNAIKYTPNGGNITVYVRPVHDRKTDEEKLYIAVKDSGAGIPEEDLGKIFKRFYQSRHRTVFPVYGQSSTGIGLYLCKQLIQLLGGSIWVKNNKKAGCTFRILLPLYRSNPQSGGTDHQMVDKRSDSETGQSTEKRENKQKGRLTFLVVEDNHDMRNYICSILSSSYNTLKATHGVEALTILDSHHVDFIISDLMMPEMDGIELSKRVKEKMSTSHIPFLMLTAKSSETAQLDSYRVGVDSYIIKPFDEEMLITRIRNILKARQRYQQLFSEKMSTDILEMDEESNDKKFMDRVLEVMKDNYQDPDFSAGDFVKAMGMSKSLLNNKLNELSGRSSGEFIRVYRLNIAYSKILHNKKTKNKNISDIAYDVGFNDPKYFTLCFSRHFNITPSRLIDNDEDKP